MIGIGAGFICRPYHFLWVSVDRTDGFLRCAEGSEQCASGAWEAPRAGLRPQTTDSFIQSAIRHSQSEMLPLPPAGYLMQTFGLRPQTADRRPRRPSAATMDHRPSTMVDYRPSSMVYGQNIVYRLITGRSLGLRSRDGHFSEAEINNPHLTIIMFHASHFSSCFRLFILDFRRKIRYIYHYHTSINGSQVFSKEDESTQKPTLTSIRRISLQRPVG